MTPRQKRIFVSDAELRRMAASGRVELPPGAIVSPLASDWLDLEGAPPAGGGAMAGEGALRAAIADTGRRLYALGFVPGTDGNISARLPDGTLLITRSGAPKGSLSPSDISRISLSGELLAGARPSSEYQLHLAIYRARPDARAVVHAHPPLATGFACAGRGLDAPLTAEMVITLGSVPLAAYATPGTPDVPASVAELARGHAAILLANHGAVTCGPDLETAFRRMETVEQAARVALTAELLGPRPIPADKLPALDLIRKSLGF